jgi:hypothetical protein
LLPQRQSIALPRRFWNGLIREKVHVRIKCVPEWQCPRCPSRPSLMRLQSVGLSPCINTAHPTILASTIPDGLRLHLGISRETVGKRRKACHDALYYVGRIIARFIIDTPAFDGKRKQGLCLPLSQGTLCLARWENRLGTSHL